VKQRWVFAALPVLTLPVLAVSVLAPPAVASALLMFSTPAHAEPMRLAQAVEYGGLPPYEIVTIVRSAGLDPIDQPIRRGPHYVLHAIGQDDQEVRVIVGARRGEIIRIVPIMSASRMPPGRGGVTMGPYERMDGYDAARPAPGYVAPQGYRYGARPSAPDDDDEDPSYDNAPRPPGAVPGAAPRQGYAPPPPRTGYAEPPPVIRATPSGRGSDISRTDLPPPSGSRAATAYPPPRGTDLPPPSGSQPLPSGPRAATAYPPPRGSDLPPSSDPRASNAPEPGRDGLLPPPPERFPQRAAPAAEKPEKPVKRAATAAGPKPAPVPKPKPATPASVTAPSAAPSTPATPAPEAAKETSKETAKTPASPAPAAETKPAAESKPSAEKPADGAVPH